MRKSFNIKRLADGTITVRVGRAVEHISGDKPKPDLYDALKYALISKDVVLSNDHLVELMQFVQDR